MLPVVESYLKTHAITYKIHEHPAVFTASEAAIHCKHIPGLHCKNLFMKDKEANIQYLVVMSAHKRLNINLLQKELQVKKLSFCSAEELMSSLGLTPGSVSPLGIINNKEHNVILIVEKEAFEAPIVSFHPNDNKATLEIPKESFHRLLDSFLNKKLILALAE